MECSIRMAASSMMSVTSQTWPTPSCTMQWHGCSLESPNIPPIPPILLIPGSWTLRLRWILIWTSLRCSEGLDLQAKPVHTQVFCKLAFSPSFDFSRLLLLTWIWSTSDLKGMAKVTTGILILRGANSPDWTSDFETQMNNWTTQYITWLQTSPIALEEAAATKWVSSSFAGVCLLILHCSNHGSYYFNQLSAVQVLAGDTNGAKNTTATYFAGIYMNQIDASGEQVSSNVFQLMPMLTCLQPLEAVRTRPYHYRCYNLAAMIVSTLA